jgi:hypothetical protein
MSTFSTKVAKKVAESSRKYCCNICQYYTDKKSNYDKHLGTLKHLNSTESTKVAEKVAESSCKQYICLHCNATFKERTGLWRHNKICNSNNDKIDNTEGTLVKYLMNENKELKNMIIEVCKQIQPGNISNTNTIGNTNMNHSNNKTFNLQFFLNETCKDAMNIKDFVDSVQLELSDLENVGKSGYIEGISNIIIKNLNALEMEKRPIHCTDNKREVIYIKDEDKWEKEDDNKPKLRKLIKEIAHKNICMFKKFREKYPDCDNGESKKSSVFNTIVYESMGGKGDDEGAKVNKIIHKITKEVGIDKSTF